VQRTRAVGFEEAFNIRLKHTDWGACDVGVEGWECFGGLPGPRST